MQRGKRPLAQIEAVRQLRLRVRARPRQRRVERGALGDLAIEPAREMARRRAEHVGLHRQRRRDLEPPKGLADRPGVPLRLRAARLRPAGVEEGELRLPPARAQIVEDVVRRPVPVLPVGQREAQPRVARRRLAAVADEVKDMRLEILPEPDQIALRGLPQNFEVDRPIDGAQRLLDQPQLLIRRHGRILLRRADHDQHPQRPAERGGRRFGLVSIGADQRVRGIERPAIGPLAEQLPRQQRKGLRRDVEQRPHGLRALPQILPRRAHRPEQLRQRFADLAKHGRGALRRKQRLAKRARRLGLRRRNRMRRQLRVRLAQPHGPRLRRGILRTDFDDDGLHGNEGAPGTPAGGLYHVLH